jgi:hypothetical protein
MAWFDAHAGSYLCLVIDQPSWKAYRVLLHDLWYPQAYEYLFGRTTIFPEPKGIALADELHERLREAHKRASEALARRQALSSDSAPVPAKVGTDRIEPKPTSAEQKTITTDGVASVDLPTPKIAFEERATWFQNELAKRDWNVHELQGQGGPNWKTSRKILDGLPVSRGVLERVAIALSKKKHPVRFKEIPEE